VCAAHSGHGVPFLIHAEQSRPDAATTFGERACATGLWGGPGIPGSHLMRLAMSYAGKLKKYGA
jgi:2,3-bisphosphoglycerate-independent phosphoglycerate mutase